MTQEIDLFRAADELITYVAQRLVDFEQGRMGSAFHQPETRYEWIRDVLCGMAAVYGKDSRPLVQALDQRLEDAHGCFAVEMLDLPGQKHLVSSLSQYAVVLEYCGGDQRPHAANVLRLLEDMCAYLPWRSYDIGLYPARDQVEGELVRMTARTPIRFTHITMGGDAGPHWASGFAPGAVTDAEGLRQTAVYQDAVRDYPDMKSWPAICTVYTGGGDSAMRATDATPFDLEIMNHAGDKFLDQKGVCWAGGMYQMTVPAEPEEMLAGEEQTPPEMDLTM